MMIEERKDGGIDTNQNHNSEYRACDDVCPCMDRIRYLMQSKLRNRLIPVYLSCIVFGGIGSARYSVWSLVVWLISMFGYGCFLFYVMKKEKRKEIENGNREASSEVIRTILFFGMIVVALLPAFFMILAQDDLFLVLYTLCLIVGMAVPTSYFCSCRRKCITNQKDEEAM
ncbi:MAG: hypothetical protein ACC608_07850 [Anaerofustis sp.]